MRTNIIFLCGTRAVRYVGGRYEVINATTDVVKKVYTDKTQAIQHALNTSNCER